MVFKHLFYIFTILGFLSTLSSTGYAMDGEDSLKSFRVQTSSVVKSKGLEAAHTELERQVKLAPGIKNYPAYIYAEKGSNWYRTQLKCASKENADALCTYINTTSLAAIGPMVVSPQHVTPGQDLLLETCIRHYWKQ